MECVCGWVSNCPNVHVTLSKLKEERRMKNGSHLVLKNGENQEEEEEYSSNLLLEVLQTRQIVGFRGAPNTTVKIRAFAFHFYSHKTDHVAN